MLAVAHDLGEEFHSAYYSGLSTKTALIKVKDDILKLIHNQKGVFLVLLDISAAFDTGNHSVLFRRIDNKISLTGTALKWFTSYFSGRSTHVLITGLTPNHRTWNTDCHKAQLLGQNHL